VSATAYYVWKFGQGGGDNAILIDAFDIQAGDFIPDDFVDVTPDPNGQLTVEANKRLHRHNGGNRAGGIDQGDGARRHPGQEVRLLAEHFTAALQQ
jgi:hypothetical protein